MEYFPLAIACGSIFFSLAFNPDASKTPYIISLVLGGANFIFPSNKLNKILCKVEDPEGMVKSYNEVRIHFPNEYDRSNPITAFKAI